MNLFTSISLLLILISSTVTALSAPGDLDLTFGTGGSVAVTLTDTSTGNGGYKAIIAPNGTIYQFGSTGLNGTSYASIISLTSNGALNPAFDGDGKLVCNFPDLSSSRFHNGYLLPDGKFLAAGNARKNDLSWNLLARFLPNGQLDSTFNGTGYVLFRNPGGVQINFFWSNVALQADGKIVVAGTLDYQMAVARFMPDGTIDTSFGTGGYRMVQITILGELWDMKLTTGGKIVAVGNVRTNEFDGNPSDFIVLQFNPDGQLDANFAEGGIKRFDLTPTTEEDAEALYGVQILPDGKILAVGRLNLATTNGAIVRFTPDGQFDPSFGDGGFKIINFNNQGNLPQDLTVQADGKIIIASVTGSGMNFLVQRLLPNGQLDPTFGTNGSVETDLGGRDFPYSVNLTSDKILLAGYCGRNTTTNSIQKMCLARYLQNNQTANTGLFRGRAVNLLGRGIERVQITVKNAATNETQTVTTDSTGNFQLADTLLGQQYVVTPQARRCYFQNTPLTINFNSPDTSVLLRANCLYTIK